MKKENTNALPSECTTIIIGQQQTTDGSMFVARSEDWDAMEAKNYEIFEDTSNGPTEFVAKDSPFRCKLPSKALGYTALSPYNLHHHWGSAGFNTAGVGMSATESIFSNDEVLKHDPLVETGVAENVVFNITLPYVSTARQGVERLGALIEEHGIAEGFGIGFVDNKEIWYLETACGHRWLACRIPKDKYFVTGNQSRFIEYDPQDKENYLASSDLIEFATKHNLYNPAQGKFNFHKAYARDIELDTTYNYPRVWGLQQMFSPHLQNDVSKNTFPVFAQAKEKISLTQLRKAFRFHYDNTEHDPYLNNNPKEIYRPVSIFRTTQTHLLQVRPELPQAIGCINYVAMGMADLGVFLPLYQGITSYPEAYTKGTNQCSNDSAYWIFRKVMALGMTNYNKYAPIIKETYLKFEAETDQRQREMEEEYLRIYKTQPLRAKDMLQEFSNKILNNALQVANDLQNRLFTLITQDIQQEYLFHGA